MSRHRLAALASGTALVTALIIVPTSSGYAATAPCAETSVTTVLDVTTAQCDRFHGDMAVHLPADSTTTVYGLLGTDSTSFRTRTETIAVRSGAIPRGLADDVALTSRLFLSATVRDGQVIRMRPYLLVTAAAVLAPYAGQQATGSVTWIAPPAGVGASRWIRIRFQGAIDADELRGRIVNYRGAVRAGNRCRAALRSGAAGSAYRTVMGRTGALTGTWFPAMHAPGDSEVNLQLSSGINYMTAGPQLADLMSGPWQPTSMSLGIHGNPIGAPASIAGSLAPRTRSRAC